MLFLRTMMKPLQTVQFTLLALVVITACRSTNISANDKSTVKNIWYIGEYIVPHNVQFNNTTIGGLSGIDYNKDKDVFYLISDDWSQINPARFYTAKIFL